VLGQGFEATTLALAPDAEGEVVATVVRAPAPSAPHGAAVLYLHGFSDYFFQVDLARWYRERGWAFYAVDLRKCGRSLRPHQTPDLALALEDYDEELDAAVAIIGAEGHDRILLVGHSTGGLILPLWAVRRPQLTPPATAGPGPAVAGLVLNSPFLDFKQSPVLGTVVLPVARAIARHRPAWVVPGRAAGRYGESLHASRQGEWDYNLDWKPLESFPVRFGWLAAIAAGHRLIHAGLDLRFPVLAMSSTRTVSARSWTPELQHGDAVLDADRLARWSVNLGRNVTLARIPEGMHDLFLSLPPAREQAYATMGTWLEAWVDH
jgi:alpha-beta hydrolase superfamily lysophospholipase